MNQDETFSETEYSYSVQTSKKQVNLKVNVERLNLSSECLLLLLQCTVFGECIQIYHSLITM